MPVVVRGKPKIFRGRTVAGKDSIFYAHPAMIKRQRGIVRKGKFVAKEVGLLIADLFRNPPKEKYQTVEWSELGKKKK